MRGSSWTLRSCNAHSDTLRELKERDLCLSPMPFSQTTWTMEGAGEALCATRISRCATRGTSVGSVNMHRFAFGHQVKFPRSFTYLHPSSLARSRSSRADTPQRCLSESEGQALLAEQVSAETAHPSDAAEKPVSLQ